MKKAYINMSDSELYAAQFEIKIEYKDGEVQQKEITNYSYSNIFDFIKENHEDDFDRSVKKIEINLIE